MDLYKEILIHALAYQEVEVRFPNLSLTGEELVHSVCYKALVQIRDIVRNEALSDPECFDRVEEIVRALEAAGSDGGFRHDFG
ncbi:hypothetical protein [Intestinimonas massiliensis (ex Afouda et al. 2020)]|uniref:hypothetical protein n=1 Tax=Intestinimonas massiliensis (ex Afouda et al. 2020) TaxID=1673721 RepID=UPI001031A96B|nr:hypothetical protein [Intestinimonas massiliensis (ex Afouda et al. 2020)]